MRPRSHERQEQVGGVKLRVRASCCCCRTAELLAVKLNQLRGDTVKTVMASQALNITVRNGSQLEGDKIRNMGFLMTCILASN